MSANEELAEQYLRQILTALGKTIAKCIPKEWGFSLFMFNDKRIFFVANLSEKDVIPHLKGFIEQGEKDAGSGQGKATGVSANRGNAKP